MDIKSWMLCVALCLLQWRETVAFDAQNRLCLGPASSRQPAQGPKTHLTQPQRLFPQTTRLYSSPGSNNDRSKAKGVYSRPSAAIERGSGFFIPGLEGSAVRLVFGTILLLLTLVNHSLGAGELGYSQNQAAMSADTAGNTFSEGLALVYSLFVLIQGAVEYIKETSILSDVSHVERSTQEQLVSSTTLLERWHTPVNDQVFRDKVQWAATSFISITSATHMMLLGPGKVLYSLGPEEPQSMSSDDEAEACEQALEIIRESKGGRLSLPSSHFIAQTLPPHGYDRTIVLQRIDDESQLCWLVTSNQLLQSFTKQDLAWLGQIGEYSRP